MNVIDYEKEYLKKYEHLEIFTKEDGSRDISSIYAERFVAIRHMEEEQKLVEDLGGKITEDGKIIFADQEEGTKKFLEGREELNKTECEIAIDTPIIFRDAEGVQVSGNDIETLQGLADFIE